MQSLRGQSVLILGSNSVVGIGAAQQFLDEGARVVLVTRTEETLRELVNKFEPFKTQMIGIVGSFDTRSQVEEIRAVMKAALNGESVNHVVSAIGMLTLTHSGISASDLTALKTALDESLYPTILCAQVFLQDLKDKEGSTYTIVSGGFAHKCYYPNAWVGTVKNAAMNGVVESLACDMASSKVRVNGNCLHYGIGMPGHDEKNQPLDVEAANVDFGRTFVKIIEKKDLRGSLVCQDSKLDTERFLQAS
jgi:NAD(P)-dependent dehydrogenase (short-subunit alcohol dehydrogenase family)